jgi:hypothetical protein
MPEMARVLIDSLSSSIHHRQKMTCSVEKLCNPQSTEPSTVQLENLSALGDG